MKNNILITPDVGNIIEHEGKVFKCIEAENLCKNCDFLQLRYNGTDCCISPRGLVCNGKIFKQVPADSVKLVNKFTPKKQPRPNMTFVYLIIITLLIWAAL